jgi:hypothetical protein
MWWLRSAKTMFSRTPKSGRYGKSNALLFRIVAAPCQVNPTNYMICAGGGSA